MSAMIIALAIIAYSVLAWIFSLTVQPGWNSSIFAPYFIVAGLYSGVCVIIIAMYLIRKYYHLDSLYKKGSFYGSWGRPFNYYHYYLVILHLVNIFQDGLVIRLKTLNSWILFLIDTFGHSSLQTI